MTTYIYIPLILVLLLLVCLTVWNMAYKFGFRDGQRSRRTNNMPEKKNPFKKVAESPDTADERRFKTILDNIENYDGTSKNQKKVI